MAKALAKQMKEMNIKAPNEVENEDNHTKIVSKKLKLLKRSFCELPFFIPEDIDEEVVKYLYGIYLCT